MRLAKNLSEAECRELASLVQDLLYLDVVDDADTYNPDKSWDGPEILEHIAQWLDAHDLVPATLQRPMGVVESQANKAIAIVDAMRPNMVNMRAADVVDVVRAITDEVIKSGQDSLVIRFVDGSEMSVWDDGFDALHVWVVTGSNNRSERRDGKPEVQPSGG